MILPFLLLDSIGEAGGPIWHMQLADRTVLCNRRMPILDLGLAHSCHPLGPLSMRPS